MSIIFNPNIIFVGYDIYVMCVRIVGISNQFSQYIIDVCVKVRSKQF